MRTAVSIVCGIVLALCLVVLGPAITLWQTVLNTEFVTSQLDVVDAPVVIAEQLKDPTPDSQTLAIVLSRDLVERTPRDQAVWSGLIDAHAQLLGATARARFEENVNQGRPGENAKPSDLQQEYLATLETLVAHQADKADHVLTLVAEHLRLWIEHEHWQVADDAYTRLAKSLPERQRREAALAVVGLGLDRVDRERGRLLGAGLDVPHELHPIHSNAIERCYVLQGEVTDDPPQLARVRTVVDRVVGHYLKREQYDLAEQAIRSKPAEAIDAGDEYAQWWLARLKDSQARRLLERSLQQYNAAESLTLTPEFKEAIDAYKTFLTQRPASPLAGQATEAIFDVGRLYQAQQAHEVAAGLYRDLAEFGKGIGMLSASAPGKPSTVERAALAAAAPRHPPRAGGSSWDLTVWAPV